MTVIAIYIGAGTNMKPINTKIDGEHIQIMLCFDSLPKTQFPSLGHVNSEDTQIDFLDELRNNAYDLGFVESKSKHVVFTNSKSQEIRYFANTPFPLGVTEDLLQEISKANTLIIAGYHPHKDILDMMKKPINIICCKNTYYGFKETNENSIVTKLYKDMYDMSYISYLSKIVYYYTDTEFKEFKNIAEVEEFNKHRNSLIEILLSWKSLVYK
jgi:hypothetical protein